MWYQREKEEQDIWLEGKERMEQHREDWGEQQQQKSQDGIVVATATMVPVFANNVPLLGGRISSKRKKSICVYIYTDSA